MTKDYIKQATALIKEFEGFSATAYKCPAGKWTIGYGRVLKTDPEGNILEPTITTREKEDTLLIRKLIIMEKGMLNKLPFLKGCQIASLLSLIYNIGEKAFYTSTLFRKLLDKKPLLEITSEILHWNKVKGIPNKGLTKRRNREALLFSNGACPPKLQTKYNNIMNYTDILNKRVLSKYKKV